MADSEESTRLFRIRKNVMEMLRDRGYSVLDEELDMDFKQFKERFGDSVSRDELTILKSKKDNPQDQIFVFFANDPNSVGVKLIKQYLVKLEQESVSKAIMIYQKKLTPSAKKGIQDLAMTQKYDMEVFQEAELLVNVTKHMLVPKHEVLTNEEKVALLNRYHLKENQLPIIQLNDPVAKYHGVHRGQVVRIIRPSETAGRYITYRYVI